MVGPELVGSWSDSSRPSDWLSWSDFVKVGRKLVGFRQSWSEVGRISSKLAGR